MSIKVVPLDILEDLNPQNARAVTELTLDPSMAKIQS